MVKDVVGEHGNFWFKFITSKLTIFTCKFLFKEGNIRNERIGRGWVASWMGVDVLIRMSCGEMVTDRVQGSFIGVHGNLVVDKVEERGWTVSCAHWA